MYYLKNDRIVYCPSFYTDEKYEHESILFYNIKKDSLNRYGSNDSLNIKFPCLKDNNINWFPKNMVKVDKIDYDKFNLPHIKKKYLKDPKKAPKVYE